MYFKLKKIHSCWLHLLPLLMAVALISLTAPEPLSGKDWRLRREIDRILRENYPANEPGAAVLVAKNGRVVLRKGYGMANLELNVPIEPDMVFRLGSITKQFTAVAILMLAEEGKLSLEDPITTFLPDYPTQGHTVTVEHLLTHTSGIKSYTEMPEWLPLWRNDMTLTELIDLFKDQPFDFAPGERWYYNNSGYILLGAIIEKASGQPYEEFIQERIFDPLGMEHSCYGSATRIIKRRAAGYQPTTDGFQNAAYLSMTQPYAAGSLLSNVDDMFRWHQALQSGSLLPLETLNKAFAPYILPDGTSTGYGYGWTLADYEGRRTIEHGGGINGFTTYVIYAPADDIFVVILTNNEGKDPALTAVKTMAQALGQPYREPVAIEIDPEILESYVGVYEISPDRERIITRDSTQLFSQVTGGSRQKIMPLSPTEFFFESGGFSRLEFVTESDGQVVSALLHRRAGPPVVAHRTDKPLPAERTAITLDPALYDRYSGEYELAPGFSIQVWREDDRLLLRATGQESAEIFPESETMFFLKVVDARIEFVLNETGEATGIILHQGGQQLPGRKIQ
ncbi:MAG: serine hydrolase [Candidatus Neomarinimicrobiota bacterium]